MNLIKIKRLLNAMLIQDDMSEFILIMRTMNDSMFDIVEAKNHNEVTIKHLVLDFQFTVHLGHCLEVCDYYGYNGNYYEWLIDTKSKEDNQTLLNDIDDLVFQFMLKARENTNKETQKCFHQMTRDMNCLLSFLRSKIEQVEGDFTNRVKKLKELLNELHIENEYCNDYLYLYINKTLTFYVNVDIEDDVKIYLDGEVCYYYDEDIVNEFNVKIVDFLAPERLTKRLHQQLMCYDSNLVNNFISSKI